MKLVVDKESLVSVAEAIRTKGNTTDDLEFPNGFVDGINAIASSGGGTEEIENIIDASGVLESTDGTVTEKVEQLIEYAYVMQNFYTVRIYSNDTIEHINIYIDWLIEFKCEYARNLKTVVGVDVSKLSSCRNLFAGCKSLVSVQVAFDMSKHSAFNMDGMFAGCTSLVDVRFVEETIKASITIPSPVLSIGNVFDLTDTENVGSVQSIVNGLAKLAEGAAAQTLTLSKNLPLTAEQKQAITTAVNNKGWSVAFA